MKIRDIKGYEEFKAYCCFELCEEHYPGWVGKEKYIISTDIPEEDLLRDFPEIMKALSPYVIISSYYRQLNNQENYNNIKHSSHKECSIDEIDSNESLSNLLSVKDFSEKICDTESLKSALLCLSEIQQSRVIRYFYMGMTQNEIAIQDGVAQPCVMKSITASIKKMRKFIS